MTSKKLNLLIITIASILAATIFNTSGNGTPVPNDVIIKFTKWALDNQKFYPTPEEANHRLRIFHQNYMNILGLNTQNSSWKAGLNKFSDLTPKEFSTKYAGFRPRTQPRNEVDLPSNGNPHEIDWVKKGAVNAVKDQGNCGSCWAFSTIAAVEGRYKLAKGKLYSLSEQQLVDCSTSYGNEGCNGGLMDYGFKYIIDHGIEEESAYPYKAKDGKCQASSKKTKVDIHKYGDVKANKCSVLETAVAQGPTSVAIDANKIMFYKKGIFDSKCGTQLDHGVTAVGYGSEGGKDFWLVRNSWGGSWGEKGYIRMIKDIKTKHSPGICGICMSASYPIV